MVRIVLLLTLFWGVLANLHGGIVERDYRTRGDGLLTYDDVNNREWLEITETLDWDLATLRQAMSLGGELSSFSLATLSELYFTRREVKHCQRSGNCGS